MSGSEAEIQEAQISFDLVRLWSEGAAMDRLSKGEAAKQVVHEAWRGLSTSPLTTAITTATMAVALFVFAAFLLVIQNVGDLFHEARSEANISVFLRDGISDQDRLSVETALRERPEVAAVSFRSKETALKSFRAALGGQSFILDGLDKENPLPSSYEIRFKKGLGSQEIYEAITNQFSANNSVEYVHYNRGLVGNITELMSILRVVSIGAVLLMLLITSFIIGNTIQLSLYARREEIEIMRLVGAVDAYIRAPYLIEGAVQGVIGFVLGMLALWGAFGAARGVIGRSPTLGLLFPDFGFINTTSLALVLVLGVAVGLFGSAIAVRRFLRD